MAEEKLGDSNLDYLSTTANIEAAEKTLRKLLKTVVPRVKSEGFLRCKYVNGRPYWYLVLSVREGGRVKQQILKYYGTRKPRSIKEAI